MIALIALVLVTVRIVNADASDCSGGIALKVLAAPEIAAPLRDVAATWVATKPSVDGHCVNVTVTGAPAADLASSLTTLAGGTIDVAARTAAPTPTEDDLPAVWVPDSSAWLTRVRIADRSAFGDDEQSLASSPVVVAMPELAAKLVGWPAAPLKPAALKPILAQGGVLKLGIADPRRDAASLAGAMVLGDALATSDQDLPALVKTFRSIVRKPDTASLLAAFGPDLNAAPASEQAVLAFNATGPPLKLVPVQIESPSPILDYPYAVRSGISREAARAAVLFRAVLAEPAARETLARQGFRTPEGAIGPGFPSAAGATGRPVVGTPVADREKVQRALGLWAAANAASRSLALLDLTSSMATATTTGGPSRVQVMAQAARKGLELFTNDSQLGMWGFASEHQQLAPIGPLSAKARAKYDQLMQAARPLPTDQAALYDTLRDAYKAMQDGFDPARPNIIVVLTDGGDSHSGGQRFRQFELDLQRMATTTKPIRVILIGVDVTRGSKGESDLRAIAQAMGGGYFPLTSPDQIQTIFLKALLQVGAG